MRAFLDQAAALDAASHTDVASYAIERGRRFEVLLANGGKCGLKDPSKLAGYRGPRHAPTSILLVNNGLHIEIVVDRDSEIGKADAAGVSDVVVEAAISTIMDLEDAVAAVDAEDKIVAYRNWLGLMSGALAANVEKGGTSFERRRIEDRSFTTPSGATLTLHGRSLMLVRNVGHHMFTDAVLDENGEEVPEAILDAAITVAGACRTFAARTGCGTAAPARSSPCREARACTAPTRSRSPTHCPGGSRNCSACRATR